VAADPNTLYDTPQAESYEKYIHENWDKLPPWEQRQAQDFLFARLHAEDETARVFAARSANQPFLNDVAKPTEHPELYWTVKCGWVCFFGTFISPFIFGPLGVFFGVYNVWKGDQEKGALQIGLTILAFVVMVILLMAGQEIMRKLIPGPEFLLT
jgi:hypothetical protein